MLLVLLAATAATAHRNPLVQVCPGEGPRYGDFKVGSSYHYRVEKFQEIFLSSTSKKPTQTNEWLFTFCFWVKFQQGNGNGDAREGGTFCLNCTSPHQVILTPRSVSTTGPTECALAWWTVARPAAALSAGTGAGPAAASGTSRDSSAGTGRTASAAHPTRYCSIS